MAEADVSRLSERQTAAVRMLVDGLTPTAIARALDVSRQTFYEWKRLPEFRAAIEAYQAEALKDIRLHLTQLGRPACEALEKALDGGEVSTVAMQAAREVLDRVGANFEPPAERDAGIETVDDRRGAWGSTETPE